MGERFVTFSLAQKSPVITPEGSQMDSALRRAVEDALTREKVLRPAKNDRLSLEELDLVLQGRRVTVDNDVVSAIAQAVRHADPLVLFYAGASSPDDVSYELNTMKGIRSSLADKSIASKGVVTVDTSPSPLINSKRLHGQALNRGFAQMRWEDKKTVRPPKDIGDWVDYAGWYKEWSRIYSVGYIAERFPLSTHPKLQGRSIQYSALIYGENPEIYERLREELIFSDYMRYFFSKTKDGNKLPVVRVGRPVHIEYYDPVKSIIKRQEADFVTMPTIILPEKPKN